MNISDGIGDVKNYFARNFICAIGRHLYKNERSFNMQDKHIVLVRYKEDRDRLINKLKYPSTVYCTGPDPVEGEISIPNIGLESYGFLHYIVNNYDNLPEFTIFSQGDPDPHVESFELAIDSTLTGGFGSFCYARSMVGQYAQGWVRSLPLVQLLKEVGIEFDDVNKCSKTLFYILPGVAFYVSRDRIRQRPKSFYEKLFSLCNDDAMRDLLFNYRYPEWYYQDLIYSYPHLRGLSRKTKLEKLADGNGDTRPGVIVACLFEALWFTIFQSFENLELINKSQALIGTIYEKNNKGPIVRNSNITKMNLKVLENDAFDYECPKYLLWREKLIEKTIGEGKKYNFKPEDLYKQFDEYGYKHITL
jgi:hypothetical protein